MVRIAYFSTFYSQPKCLLHSTLSYVHCQNKLMIRNRQVNTIHVFNKILKKVAIKVDISLYLNILKYKVGKLGAGALQWLTV